MGDEGVWATDLASRTHAPPFTGEGMGEGSSSLTLREP